MKKYVIASGIALLSLISLAGAQEFTFVNNLSVGAENPDVTFLQSWLISNGYDIPAISSGAATKGYFGAQTKVALMRYQSEHGIPGTGYFGPMTRAKFNERKVNFSPLNLISPNGGEEWQKGSTQTIKWNSPSYVKAANADIKLVEYQYCPDNAMCKFRPALIYSIASNQSINRNSYNWIVGSLEPIDCPAGYSCTPVSISDGQYTIQICETGTTNCDSSNKPFTISSSASPSVKVTSPNGGEVWPANSTRTISWSYSGSISNKIDLYLDQENIGVNCVTSPCPMLAWRAPYVLDKNISVNTNYNWIVATDIDNVAIPAGEYRVRICPAGSTTNCDSSDTYFTISANEVVPDINIISPNGRESYNVGDRATIRWKLDGTIRPGYKILLSLNPGMGYITTVPATDTSYSWTIPEGICLGGDACTTLASGSYKIYAQLYDGTPCVGLCAPTFPSAKLLAHDESDRNFTINTDI